MKGKSRAERIIEQDPNGLVVMDLKLNIVDHNKAFLELFEVPSDEEIIGRNVNDVIGQVIFDSSNVIKERHKIKYHKNSGRYVDPVTFSLEMDDLSACFFVDVTEHEKERERITEMKAETVIKAQEVIDKQMMVAQEIASLLGETTAETKVQLLKIIEIFKSEEELKDGITRK